MALSPAAVPALLVTLRSAAVVGELATGADPTEGNCSNKYCVPEDRTWRKTLSQPKPAPWDHAGKLYKNTVTKSIQGAKYLSIFIRHYRVYAASAIAALIVLVQTLPMQSRLSHSGIVFRKVSHGPMAMHEWA